MFTCFSWNNKKEEIPQPVCRPFMIGTKVIMKSTNSPGEVTMIKVDNMGMVTSVAVKSVKIEGENNPHCDYEAFNVPLNEFITDYAW